MPRFIALAAFVWCAHAGTIQGVVLEQASGRPLNRTILRLTRIQSMGESPSPALAVRSGASGQFVFQSIAPGSYILQAVRDGYFPLEFGQRIPVGRGTPIPVTADSDLFAELRMRHKGAITGRVFDENGVGAAGISVTAYRARQPLRSSGTGVSDDRGVYRIHGLDPGKYWVRSQAHLFDDGSGWLPVFGPQTQDSASARVHQVTVDTDTPDADLRAEPGRLFHLGGRITCDVVGSVTVAISSEAEHRSTQSGCMNEYRFEGVAPGAYEIFAVLPDGSASGFTELTVGGNMDGANMHLRQTPLADIEVRRAGSNAVVDTPLTLMGFRRDLFEIPTPREITGKRIALHPGHWFLHARVPPGQFVTSIVNHRAMNRRPGTVADPDWFEVTIDTGSSPRIVVTVSDQAGRIGGTVKADGRLVPGAPVFLWPVTEGTRRSLGTFRQAGGFLQALSDTEGRFGFDGLPPGDYRLLASFDATEIDEDLIAMSRAPSIHVEALQVASIELLPWVAP